MDRGFVLYSKGFEIILGDLGSGEERILVWEEARTNLSVAYVCYNFWVKLLGHHGLFDVRTTSQQGAHPTSWECVGLTKNQEDELQEWVVSACYFKERSFGPVNLVLQLWVFSLSPSLGHNTLPIVKFNCMLGMWSPPRHSRVGCHESGWTNFQVASLIPNSIYSLENWVIFSLTQRGSGGLRLLPSWHI